MFSIAYFFLWAAGCVASGALFLFAEHETPSFRLGVALIPMVITLFITAVCKAGPP